jgi:DNA mismatch repair protein MutS2
MIYPESFEQKTGFDKVRIDVQNRCVTQSAKEKVATAAFTADKETIIKLLSQTAEMKTICMLDDSFPDSGYVDTGRFVPKIKTVGNYLEPYELLSLRTALMTVNRISQYFIKKGASYPTLNALVSSATQRDRKEKYFMSEIVEAIDHVIDLHAQVKDIASPELYSIRKDIHSKQSVVSRRIQSILKAAQQEGIVDAESGINMRDGHAVIPVPAMNKRKLKGLIVGESSSGRTVFVEPMEVVELNNAIRELEFAEQREIVKILTRLADFMRPSYLDIAMAGDILTEIDFIRAKAYHAIEISSGMPIIVDEPKIYLRKAKHPALMKALAKEHKEVIPLDIDLNHEQRILLVSGPNAGGKSVCLKTVGLLQYMLQCGFPVPASEISEMGVFRNIFIDIGDEQSLENDLSTYSSHLTNMKIFMKNANQHTLILIDEFGSGTEPSAGGAIAEAVLSDILKKNAFGVITTHYTSLKYFASSTEGIINGAMLFDVQHIQPLFKLETGIPGSSFAFEIARKTGLPETVLKDAESKLGNNQVQMEKSIREIARDKRYWENKRDNIRKTDRKLEELSEKYEKELNDIKALRNKLIHEAREEAMKILSSANREIEQTIRIIKESQADKEKTKLARQKIDDLKKHVAENEFVDKTIEREIEKIQNRKARKSVVSNKPSQPPVPTLKANISPTDNQLSAGDRVKIKGQTAVGEIVTVGNNNVSIALGNIIINLAPDKIEKISPSEYRNTVTVKSSSIQSELLVKRLNFKSSLDVRGERSLEALEQVALFIDEAIMLGINEVRILHGKGNGILKDEIRRYLKSFGQTIQFFDEHEEAGGAGITVVQLSDEK